MRIDCARLFEHLGCTLRQPVDGPQTCPVCREPGETLKIATTTNSLLFLCTACHFTGDPFSLVAAALGISPEAARSRMSSGGELHDCTEATGQSEYYSVDRRKQDKLKTLYAETTNFVENHLGPQPEWHNSLGILPRYVPYDYRYLKDLSGMPRSSVKYSVDCKTPGSVFFYRSGGELTGAVWHNADDYSKSRTYPAEVHGVFPELDALETPGGTTVAVKSPATACQLISAFRSVRGSCSCRVMHTAYPGELTAALRPSTGRLLLWTYRDECWSTADAAAWYQLRPGKSFIVHAGARNPHFRELSRLLDHPDEPLGKWLGRQYLEVYTRQGPGGLAGLLDRDGIIAGTNPDIPPVIADLLHGLGIPAEELVNIPREDQEPETMHADEIRVSERGVDGFIGGRYTQLSERPIRMLYTRCQRGVQHVVGTAGDGDNTTTFSIPATGKQLRNGSISVLGIDGKVSKTVRNMLTSALREAASRLPAGIVNDGAGLLDGGAFVLPRVFMSESGDLVPFYMPCSPPPLGNYAGVTHRCSYNLEDMLDSTPDTVDGDAALVLSAFIHTCLQRHYHARKQGGVSLIYRDTGGQPCTPLLLTVRGALSGNRSGAQGMNTAVVRPELLGPLPIIAPYALWSEGCVNTVIEADTKRARHPQGEYVTYESAARAGSGFDSAALAIVRALPAVITSALRTAPTRTSLCDMLVDSLHLLAGERSARAASCILDAFAPAESELPAIIFRLFREFVKKRPGVNAVSCGAGTAGAPEFFVAGDDMFLGPKAVSELTGTCARLYGFRISFKDLVRGVALIGAAPCCDVPEGVLGVNNRFWEHNILKKPELRLEVRGEVRKLA